MSQKVIKELILVDGTSYLYRAYYAIKNLRTSQGEASNAIYGVINMLRKILKDTPNAYMAVIFDAAGKNFRDELYPDYKGTRKTTPNDLISQIEPLQQLIQAMGIPLLCYPGVEADDVIATLAKRAAEQDIYCLIYSSDKDLTQLVNDKIRMLDTVNNYFYDFQGVVNKYGVKPDQIVDYLTLIGDSVDNIPGVDGVGKVTAKKWLTEYGSLSEIIAHAENLKGKGGISLRNSLDKIALSQQLITLKDDLILAEQVLDLQRSTIQVDKLRQLYQRFEFKSWLAELNAHYSTEYPAQLAINGAVIYELSALKQCVDYFNTHTTPVVLELYTDSIAYMQANIIGIGLANKDKQYYIPFAHTQATPLQLDIDTGLQILKPLLENPRLLKISYDLKWIKNVLNQYHIHLQGIYYDVLLAAYILDSIANRGALEDLVMRYLDYTITAYEDLAGKGKKKAACHTLTIALFSPFVYARLYALEELFEITQAHLDNAPTLQALFSKLEMPVLEVLSAMECQGVQIDKTILQQQSIELTTEIVNLEQRAYSIAGKTFNLHSPKQIQDIFFQQLNYPVLAKTPKGQPSTSEAVLQELAEQYELPRLILEHRSLAKLKSTYTDKLPQLIDNNTARVHTIYHQAVTSTGRLSSSDPNLQNIPIRTAPGRRIRQSFTARKGYCIVAADYSQIELRIMAHIAKDEGLQKAFQEGLDIHKATAAEVFAVALDKVSAEQRHSAKAINFGLIYGMSEFGLSKQLGIERSQAKEYIDLYFQRYPSVQSYMQTTRVIARERGYVETLYGRRLYLPEINASNLKRRQAAERMAINAPMQGSAADIIKQAMIDVQAYLLSHAPENVLIMQVHDELVLEVLETQRQEVMAKVKQLMEKAVVLQVPLIATIGYGENWDEAH